jgi:hypothetical protein
VLCTKVSRYIERNDHAERLVQPMKRVGPKGSGQFEPVSWDAALDDIAAHLRSLQVPDPETILPYSYAGTMGLVQGESMDRRFFHKLGATLLDRTICSMAGGEAMVHTLGGKVGMRIEFFAEAKLILIWGSNSIASNLHFWRHAQAAKRAGARLVCIDPRKTETADKCDEHIALLPGTDAALALALMHELIVHDWLDHDYIANHTLGWEQLRERALQWPPSRAAEVCGIPEAQIVALAEAYGTTKPAAIRLNYGMQRVRGGGNAARAIACLPALVGAWRDRAGGLLLSSSGHFPVDRAALQRPDLLAGRRPRTINMSTIGDALLDTAKPVKAIVVYNSNPVAVAPDSAKVVAGFAREDLFTVVLEQFRTDTADYADYLLPATTQLEHWDIHCSYGHTDVLLNRPAVAPRGEARSNAWVFRELARRMGFDEPCFSDDDEALCRTAFAENAIDYAQMLTQGFTTVKLPEAPFAEGQFPTPSGRCEFFSARLEAMGMDGLPDHVPNWEPAGSSTEFPLAMISPPARNFPQLDLRQRDEPARHRGRAAAGDPRGRRRRARHRGRRDGARVQPARRAPLPRRGVAPRAPGRGARHGHLVAQVRRRRHQRQPAHEPAPDRHRPRPDVLRLPRRSRTFVRGLPRTDAGRRPVPHGLRRPRLLLAVRQRPHRHHAGRQAGARVARRPGHLGAAEGQARTHAAHPPLRLDRTRPARQPQLQVVRRPAPPRRRVERGGRAAVLAHAQELVLSGGRLRGLPRLLQRGAAKAEAEAQRALDLEVAVYPVPAYSTLGWMNWAGGDPLLSTFIGYPEGELARLVFHELAHQVLYVPGDTVFNESYATAVERIGGGMWLQREAGEAARREYAQFDGQRQEFRALALNTRRALTQVYESPEAKAKDWARSRR